MKAMVIDLPTFFRIAVEPLAWVRAERSDPRCTNAAQPTRGTHRASDIRGLPRSYYELLSAREPRPTSPLQPMATGEA